MCPFAASDLATGSRVAVEARSPHANMEARPQRRKQVGYLVVALRV